MTSRPDPIADRRAELQRRLAALSPEQRAGLATAAASAPAPVQVVVHRDPGAHVPMSFAQELLWRLERASPGHAYNVPRAVRLNGSLDLGALQRSLDTLVDRHEALRTTFDLVNEVPTQVVNGPQPVPLTTIDVGHLPVDERVMAARVHMRNLARTQFDLAVDNQLRAWVIRLSRDDAVLFLLSHHVTSDGWSGNILMRELTALYAAYREHRPHELAPVTLQFGDYATWQRSHLSGQRLETLLDFWRKQLAGAPALLDFPTDRSRPPVPGFAGSLRTSELPPSVVADIHALARSNGATSFMVLLAAYNILIHRYSGAEELVIGTPVAGRSYAELENVVGFFSNTLLIRTSVHGTFTFRELLAKVRHASLSAFDNQDIPLETLLLARGEDGRPIASVPQFVLSTEDPDRERLAISGVATTHVREAFGSTKFDFMLSAAERADGLKLAAEFRTELFDDATVDRMLEQFGTVLQSALAAPDTPINRLEMLNAREKTVLLDEWNDTQVEYPAFATLVSLIQDQSRRTPDAVAVQAQDRTLTYGELDARTTALAARIRQRGAAAGVLIGVCAERSIEMVVALVAVMKSGAAYVPLDPDYPAERLAFMLSDSATPIILTQAHLVPLLPLAKVVLLDEDVPRGDVVTADWPPPSPDDAAYMIYTSGSTGMPKGALNAHRGIVNRLLWMQQQYELNSTDVVLQKTPYSFDVSVWEFFWPLITGARIVVAEPGGHRDPSYLAGVIEEAGVTIIHFVPSMLRAFISGAPRREQLRSLRHVMASGEALPADVVPDFRSLFTNARLHNLYGPTECAVDVTHWTVPADGVVQSIPIGRPVANTQMYVLDAVGAPTPIGVSGELHIGGVQVGMGYHNRADLTAEKFVADPFATRAASRLYKTGDLARWTVGGVIEYLGRLDFQVKLRGFRVELGEIETTIARHPAIREAICVVREMTQGDQRLIAYAVVKPEITGPPAIELRDWVRRTLPEHMVPAAFVFLDHIPLTSSGKADRKALPVPQLADQARPHQAPRSTIEHELVQIWERLLSPSRPISAFDDFFDIGGHSLLAIQMLAEVERIRGQRVPLAWLFESSTIEALAARLSDSLFSAEEPPLVVLQAQGSATPIAFVHGDWTGGGWYSRRLAPLVAPDAPFFVLPTIGNDEDVEPWTIERMAARHVAELRKEQPRGPYRVAGFCVGGIVAYEMARQLQTAGETVERLVLIDSSPMNARIRALGSIMRMVPAASANQKLQRQSELLRRVRWAHGRVDYFNNLPKGSKSTWIVDKITKTLPRILGKRAGLVTPPVAPATAVESTQLSATPAAVVGDDANRDVLMLRTQATAASAYIPGKFAGRVDFLFAEGAPGFVRRNNPVERWRLLASDVQLRTMPTGHISLITSHLHVLADAFKHALND